MDVAVKEVLAEMVPLVVRLGMNCGGGIARGAYTTVTELALRTGGGRFG